MILLIFHKWIGLLKEAISNRFKSRDLVAIIFDWKYENFQFWSAIPYSQQLKFSQKWVTRTPVHGSISKYRIKMKRLVIRSVKNIPVTIGQSFVLIFETSAFGFVSKLTHLRFIFNWQTNDSKFNLNWILPKICRRNNLKIDQAEPFN